MLIFSLRVRGVTGRAFKPVQKLYCSFKEPLIGGRWLKQLVGGSATIILQTKRKRVVHLSL